MDLGLAVPMGLQLAEPMDQLVEPMGLVLVKPMGHLGTKGIVFLLFEPS